MTEPPSLRRKSDFNGAQITNYVRDRPAGQGAQDRHILRGLNGRMLAMGIMA